MVLLIFPCMSGSWGKVWQITCLIFKNIFLNASQLASTNFSLLGIVSGHWPDWDDWTHELQCTTFYVCLIPLWVPTLCDPWWAALYYILCWLGSFTGSHTVHSQMSCIVLHFMSAWFPGEFPRESAWSACDFTWPWVHIYTMCLDVM